jgi:glutathione S-transferase
MKFAKFSTRWKHGSLSKNFLVGNRLTLSDVAFAVVAAPMVLPPAYGGPLPSFDQMPPPMQAAIMEMRGRPAGAFALQVYDHQRARSSAAAGCIRGHGD